MAIESPWPLATHFPPNPGSRRANPWVGLCKPTIRHLLQTMLLFGARAFVCQAAWCQETPAKSKPDVKPATVVDLPPETATPAPAKQAEAGVSEPTASTANKPKSDKPAVLADDVRLT